MGEKSIGGGKNGDPVSRLPELWRLESRDVV
jgi:hypothetical protein